MESMVDSGRLELVCNKCGFSNGLCVSSMGNSGGIGLWWRDQNVTLNSYSNRHISVIVKDEKLDSLWCTHGIYGWPEKANKYKT